MSLVVAKVTLALSYVAVLASATDKNKWKDEEVIASQRTHMLRWRDKFASECAHSYHEKAAIYADLGPTAVFLRLRLGWKSPLTIRGVDAIKAFCNGLISKVGLKDFRAFEDEGALRADVLVVDQDEVIVTGNFSFNAIQGRFLSQTWVRVGKKTLLGGDDWKIKSHMFAIDAVDNSILEKKANKTVEEEVIIVKKAEDVLNGKNLTASDAKELEHEVKEIAKEKAKGAEGTDTAAARGFPFFSMFVVLAFAGLCFLLFRMRRNMNSAKYNFGNVTGPDRMLG